MDRHFIAPVFDAAAVRKPFNLNYALRRTFVRVNLIEKGHHVEKVARLSGHSDPRTTVGYSALNDDEDREVMDSTRDSYGCSIAASSETSEGGRIGHAG